MKYADIHMPSRKWFQCFDGGWASRPWKKGECGAAHDAALSVLDTGSRAKVHKWSKNKSTFKEVL